MKRLKMAYHDPNDAKNVGDCFRACVAMLLGADAVTDVPHFLKSDDTDGRQMFKRTNRWLSRYGLRLLAVPVYIGTNRLSTVISNLSVINGNHPYMLWAYQSPATVRRDESHSVIVVGPNVWCDPACPERKHIDPDEYLADKEGYVWVATLVHKTQVPR